MINESSITLEVIMSQNMAGLMAVFFFVFTLWNLTRVITHKSDFFSILFGITGGVCLIYLLHLFKVIHWMTLTP